VHKRPPVVDVEELAGLCPTFTMVDGHATHDPDDRLVPARRRAVTRHPALSVISGSIWDDGGRPQRRTNDA
jgi:hypothetical protein